MTLFHLFYSPKQDHICGQIDYLDGKESFAAFYEIVETTPTGPEAGTCVQVTQATENYLPPNFDDVTYLGKGFFLKTQKRT